MVHIYHHTPAPEFRDVEVCPVPPEPLVSLPELAAPPLWALGCVCRNSGKRGPKYEVVRPNYGAWQATYPYDDAGNTHGVMWTEAQRKRTLKKSKLEEKVSARKAAKRGSLSEDDYRFWAGSQYGRCTVRRVAAGASTGATAETNASCTSRTRSAVASYWRSTSSPHTVSR